MNPPNHLASTGSGPLDSGHFPDLLLARVVTQGFQPRLHGYDVESDLALSYGPTELAFLALTGELPEPEAAKALDVIVVFLAPLSVAHAPTHAAVLAQLSGADSSATLSVAAIALSEQAKYVVDEHEELLGWLDEPNGEPPIRYQTTDFEEAASVDRLNSALEPTGLRVPILTQQPTRLAALLAALHAAGFRTRQQFEAVLVWARLPAVVAEACAETAANFRNYSMNVPRFTYQDSK